MKDLIFNNGEISQQQAIEILKAKLADKAPFINVSSGAFGSEMIFFLVSFQPKHTWSHGYVENSNYTRLHLNENGIIEQFTCSLYQKDKPCSYETRLNEKFRKCTVKSLDKAIEKLSIYFDKINEHYK